MYSDKVTAKQIEKAEIELSVKEPGFKTERLSVSDVISLNQELYGLADAEKKIFIRPLPPRLRRAVFSERVLCKWDFKYFRSRYHHVMDWQTEKYVRMQPKVAQLIIDQIFAEHEEKKMSVDLQDLKARQLGLTTDAESRIEHRVLFHPNTRAAVGSANPEKSAKMVQMIEDSIDRIPFWMLPTITQHKKSEFIEFKQHGSWISVYHGSMKTGFARGQTPTVCHLSEVTEFLDPYTDIDAALMFAMHKGPRRILILESTAGYIGDWFNLQWEWNKERWGKEGQVARLRPVFLPWFVGRDMYPTPTEEMEHPIPKRWKPSDLTLKHAEAARVYVKSDPILRAALGDGWTLPIEQQYWWEYTREYYKAGGKLNDFLRECPANDTECFSSKYSTVFDAEVIINLESQMKEPVAMYVLDGPSDEVRDELKPDRRMVDTDKRPLVVDKRYTLYPVKMSLWSRMMDPDKIIFVWELPRDGQTYGLGVDTSKGIGQDRSTIEGMRKATMTESARQVCEFASSWLSANDLPPWVHCIARMFQVKDKSSERMIQPRLAIEVMNGGDACQIACQKMGWRNFHHWVRIDKREINEGKANFLGVQMTEYFRDQVFGHTIKAIKDGLVDVDSPWFMKELGTLEKDEEKRRIDHAPGMHDDRFIGLGIILVSLHVLDWESLKSTFGKGRILTNTPVLGEPKEKTYARQSPQSAISKTVPNEEVARVLWTPRSDEWDGYNQRFAPRWTN